VIPYVTLQPDGSYLTNKITITRDDKNSTVGKDLGGVPTAYEPPTWTVKDMIL
jgi:hypothetical protein